MLNTAFFLDPHDPSMSMMDQSSLLMMQSSHAQQPFQSTTDRTSAAAHLGAGGMGMNMTMGMNMGMNMGMGGAGGGSPAAFGGMGAGSAGGMMMGGGGHPHHHHPGAGSGGHPNAMLWQRQMAAAAGGMGNLADVLQHPGGPGGGGMIGGSGGGAGFLQGSGGAGMHLQGQSPHPFHSHAAMQGGMGPSGAAGAAGLSGFPGRGMGAMGGAGMSGMHGAGGSLFGNNFASQQQQFQQQQLYGNAMGGSGAGGGPFSQLSSGPQHFGLDPTGGNADSIFAAMAASSQTAASMGGGGYSATAEMFRHQQHQPLLQQGQRRPSFQGGGGGSTGGVGGTGMGSSYFMMGGGSGASGQHQGGQMSSQSSQNHPQSPQSSLPQQPFHQQFMPLTSGIHTGGNKNYPAYGAEQAAAAGWPKNQASSLATAGHMGPMGGPAGLGADMVGMGGQHHPSTSAAGMMFQGAAYMHQQQQQQLPQHLQHQHHMGMQEPLDASNPQFMGQSRRRSSSLSSSESMSGHGGASGVGGVPRRSSLGHTALFAEQQQQQHQQFQQTGEIRLIQPHAVPTDADQLVKGKIKRKRAKTFPEKLMEAMINHAKDDAVAWLPDGKSFVIVSSDLFVKDVLNLGFKEAKYASFIRKLHRWGFVRLTSGTGTDCFYHPLFQRNRRDLASKISCSTRDKDGNLKSPRGGSGSGGGGHDKPPSLAGVEKFIRAKAAAAEAAKQPSAGGGSPSSSRQRASNNPSRSGLSPDLQTLSHRQASQGGQISADLGLGGNVSEGGRGGSVNKRRPPGRMKEEEVDDDDEDDLDGEDDDDPEGAQHVGSSYGGSRSRVLGNDGVGGVDADSEVGTGRIGDIRRQHHLPTSHALPGNPHHLAQLLQQQTHQLHAHHLQQQQQRHPGLGHGGGLDADDDEGDQDDDEGASFAETDGPASHAV